VEKIDATSGVEVQGTLGQRAKAYAVHAYTAAGIGFAFAAAMEICASAPDPRLVFIYLFAAVLVDATDGPFARRFDVKRWAGTIDGRKIDDIVDYITYTFLPLLLMWRMGWLPAPAAVWIIPALIASLFGFTNLAAKDESGGFFLGFPSYWNVVAFYAGLWAGPVGIWVNAGLVLALALLTVLPVRFLYPNLAPRPWKLPLLAGAGVWFVLLVWILVDYPKVSDALLSASLVYPVLYTALSWHLSRTGRRS
jgi:phosphatidylcholine synthase